MFERAAGPPRTGIQFDHQKMYTVAEIEDMMSVCKKTVIRAFQDEPGVVKLTNDAARLVRRKNPPRKKVMLRVPGAVLERVIEKLAA